MIDHHQPVTTGELSHLDELRLVALPMTVPARKVRINARNAWTLPQVVYTSTLPGVMTLPRSLNLTAHVAWNWTATTCYYLLSDNGREVYDSAKVNPTATVEENHQLILPGGLWKIHIWNTELMWLLLVLLLVLAPTSPPLVRITCHYSWTAA